MPRMVSHICPNFILSHKCFIKCFLSQRYRFIPKLVFIRGVQFLSFLLRDAGEGVTSHDSGRMKGAKAIPSVVSGWHLWASTLSEAWRKLKLNIQIKTKGDWKLKNSIINFFCYFEPWIVIKLKMVLNFWSSCCLLYVLRSQAPPCPVYTVPRTESPAQRY